MLYLISCKSICDYSIGWMRNSWPYPLAFLLVRYSLRSLDRHDLFVPWTRSSMAQIQTFTIIGPALWSQLFLSIHFSLLTGAKECLFSFSHDCSLFFGSLTLEALLNGVHCEKFYINVYNTIQSSVPDGYGTKKLPPCPRSSVKSILLSVVSLHLCPWPHKLLDHYLFITLQFFTDIIIFICWTIILNRRFV